MAPKPKKKVTVPRPTARKKPSGKGLSALKPPRPPRMKLRTGKKNKTGLPSLDMMK